MPKYRRCWVPNCHNTRRTNSEKTRLFSFPSDPGRCMNWLIAIGDPTLAVCTLQTLIHRRYVCMEHFMPRMLTASGRAGWNAVPIIFNDVRPELQEKAINSIQEALRTFLEGIPPDRRPAPPSLNVTVNMSFNVLAFPDSSPLAGEERTEPVEGVIAAHLFQCAMFLRKCVLALCCIYEEENTDDMKYNTVNFGNFLALLCNKFGFEVTL